jgi:hypothetical protein
MYGGYYGGWGYYDDDWMFGLAIGTTMFATAAIVASDDDDDDDDDDEDDVHVHTTTTTTTQGGLPCTPAVYDLQGVNYYACGAQYYILAYAATGPVYMPVPAPQGLVPAAPAAIPVAPAAPAR